MLFVYGVVRNEHRLPDPPPLGVGRPARPVWLVHCGPVAAAVSEAPAELVEVGEPEARRHLDVLVELLAGGPVVPLRVGSLAPDERAVHDEVLDPAAYQLRQRLDALEGMVEVHVDADEDEVAAIRAVIAADRGLAAASATARDASPASRLALGERVADEVMRRRRRQAEALLAELRPVAVADAARGPIGGPQDPVLRWAFLVHRGDEPRQRDLAHFDAAVERARATHPELAIRYTGPLPAFHFLDLVQPGDAAGLARHHGRWGW
ncbi:MAG: GvpL/GvpF family gas vesicle protein [Frankia sp.]|nr:GvpL/GvpF family gas vesicle protein [Frankia sp.]